jgi:hypothetical protein
MGRHQEGGSGSVLMLDPVTNAFPLIKGWDRYVNVTQPSDLFTSFSGDIQNEFYRINLFSTIS